MFPDDAQETFWKNLKPKIGWRLKRLRSWTKTQITLLLNIKPKVEHEASYSTKSEPGENWGCPLKVKWDFFVGFYCFRLFTKYIRNKNKKEIDKEYEIKKEKRSLYVNESFKYIKIVW